MATVGDLLRRARTILQEITQDGVRWTNAELLDWLNEAYATVLAIRPSANTINAKFACVVGTRQELPTEADRLLGVVRNLSTKAQGLIVTAVDRGTLDATRRRWHGEPQTEVIEHFMFDSLDPRRFYVYPPASAAARLEIIYSRVPEPHAQSEARADSAELLRLPESYAPILLDMVLARAFSKDAEHAANLQRATLHSQSAQAALGLKIQGAATASPNARAGAR
jgi:hypothetical protein